MFGYCTPAFAEVRCDYIVWEMVGWFPCVPVGVVTVPADTERVVFGVVIHDVIKDVGVGVGCRFVRARVWAPSAG